MSRTKKPSKLSADERACPPTSLPTDQRGVPRPQAGRFDIGAFEVRSEDQTTTWNPSDKAPDVTLANGNLTFITSRTVYIGVRAVASASTGKKYWELTANRIKATQASNFLRVWRMARRR
jgi:hypothetical protein